jgi:hypothetical protein
METVFGFAALVMATILGLFGALALQALLLRATFALMQPATADGRPLRPPLERGGQRVRPDALRAQRIFPAPLLPVAQRQSIGK